MCHMDVFQFLLSAFGITREEALRIPSPFGDYMPQGSSIPPDRFYVELAAYGFSVEIPNAEWWARMAAALRSSYGFSDQEVRWFTMHAELDADHGDEFRKHALEVAESPGGLSALREKSLAMAEMVKNVWNGRLYALQRGASNVYFSVVRSALSIPPWSDPLQAEVASWWGQFRIPLPVELWGDVIRARFPDKDERRVRECIARLEDLKAGRPSIRREEYDAFVADEDQASNYFEARKQSILPSTGKFLSRLVAVARLREVRALLGFTRIDAPEMDPTMEIFNEEHGLTVTPAPISAAPLDWLPAVENLGEGVFVRLNLARLAGWENRAAVKRRAENLLNAYSAWRQRRGLQALRGQRPRLILLHTLAHLLMRQMSLDCGYSSASLRERIYSDETMAALLIYTSTPDSDGSLGGLVRQTKPPEKFEGVLLSSVELARVCSGDPLCREHDPRRTERLNGAACHACAMASETSCEFGNRLLDRALVLNLPNEAMSGYFDDDR